MNRDIQHLSSFFDEKFYLENNPDIRRRKIKPLKHWLSIGIKQNRMPNPNIRFDKNFYISNYPDVKKSGLDPFHYYLVVGIKEGRKSSHENTNVVMGRVINRDQSTKENRSGINGTNVNNVTNRTNVLEHSKKVLTISEEIKQSFNPNINANINANINPLINMLPIGEYKIFKIENVDDLSLFEFRTIKLEVDELCIITQRIDKNEEWKGNLTIKVANDHVNQTIEIGPSDENIKCNVVDLKNGTNINDKRIIDLGNFQLVYSNSNLGLDINFKDTYVHFFKEKLIGNTYPVVLNGAIIYFNSVSKSYHNIYENGCDFILMAYRNMEPTNSPSEIWLAYIDKDTFNVIKNEILIQSDTLNKKYYEDPRFNLLNDKLILSYSKFNFPDKVTIFFSEFNVGSESNETAKLGPEQTIYELHLQTWEKNWTFFTSKGKAYCLYKITPIEIYEISDKYNIITKIPNQWTHPHKDLRGGCPPVFFKEKFWIFTHCTKYNIYCVVIDNNFRVVGYSLLPLLPKTKKKSIYFPVGAIINGETWLISMGVNDRDVGIIKMNHGSLESSISWI